jgi:hypothetical protein
LNLAIALCGDMLDEAQQRLRRQRRQQRRIVWHHHGQDQFRATSAAGFGARAGFGRIGC